MPRKKKRRAKTPAEEHTHLALQIDAYKVRARAAINHYAHEPQYAWRDTQDEPLYEFETHLEFTAVCTHPEERAGAPYEVTIYGDASPESDIYRTLKDIQLVDKNHIPKYRTYRGGQIPVYAPPKGMGTLAKERGKLVGTQRFGRSHAMSMICWFYSVTTRIPICQFTSERSSGSAVYRA